MERTAVVTGASRGIGLAVASQLAARGLDVVLVARDAARGEEAVRAIRGAGGAARFLRGDLASLRGARALAGAILDACPRLDVLVHNAGIWPVARELNEDGLERAFATNHLAPFLLNHLLAPRLAESRARVVQVSAGLYVMGRPDLARTPRGEDFHPIRTYATTKLVNLLMTPLFAARWRDAGVTINAVHPGVIRTDLGDRPGLLGGALRLVKRLWKSPDAGARPVVRLALDAALASTSGAYFNIEEEAPLAPVARDEALARALWDQAIALAGLDASESHAA
jgi:NAD(P)-dependent dehydrogenase (short-subunit alcohol dehydrogenase family)